MAYQPTWRERFEDARPYFGPALALAIVVGFMAWLGWWYFAVRRPAAREAAQTAAGDPIVRMRALTAESQAREEEANRAREAGRFDVAAERAHEALRSQREANALVPTGAKDLAREKQLRATLDELDAEPLRSAVGVGRSLGAAARVRESWAEALQALGEARRAQAELNARFPDSRLADRAALEALDSEISEVLAGQAMAREFSADAAAAQGRRTEAAAAYAEAIEAWQEIAGRLSLVHANAAARVDALSVKRETALAAEPLEKLGALTQEIDGALRARRFRDAIEKITAAAALLERTARAYPRGLGAAAETRRKISFLFERRDLLESFTSEVSRLLVPLPGGRLELGRTEISQDLYARITGANPSRNADPNLPVESVTWHEAREFCARLSWLLGRSVRLPTEAEFRAARLAAPEIGWSAENAEGRVHPVGARAKGKSDFADLAGNVAEWLQPARENGELAPVAGGSYLDAAATLQRTPIVEMEKRMRARHIGFRVIAERE